ADPRAPGRAPAARPPGPRSGDGVPGPLRPLPPPGADPAARAVGGRHRDPALPGGRLLQLLAPPAPRLLRLRGLGAGLRARRPGDPLPDPRLPVGPAPTEPASGL